MMAALHFKEREKMKKFIKKRTIGSNTSNKVYNIENKNNKSYRVVGSCWTLLDAVGRVGRVGRVFSFSEVVSRSLFSLSNAK